MIGSISEMTRAKPDTSITTYNIQFYMYRRFIHHAAATDDMY